MDFIFFFLFWGTHFDCLQGILLLKFDLIFALKDTQAIKKMKFIHYL